MYQLREMEYLGLKPRHTKEFFYPLRIGEFFFYLLKAVCGNLPSQLVML